MTLTRDRIADHLGTWFGCGHVPKAPGTAGAFGALPVHFLLRHQPPVVYGLVIVVLMAVGVWAGESIARRVGKDDPQTVVIDEVVGTLLALSMIRDQGWLALVVAFVLFRILDATKPWPIRRFEHVGTPGWGIMLDDVAAGVVAGALVRATWSIFAFGPTWPFAGG